jgi:hypothetical protein
MPTHDTKATALVRQCTADVWGLYATGTFRSETDKRAAWKWLELVAEEWGSLTEAVRALGMPDTVRRRIAMFINEGRTTEQALPRHVVTIRKALGAVTGEPLPFPDIPGASPRGVRNRVQWIRVWHYDDYLSKLAEDIAVDRSYLAHFLNDLHRGFSPTLARGFNQSGFSVKWVETGEGKPWKGSPPDWIG